MAVDNPESGNEPAKNDTAIGRSSPFGKSRQSLIDRSLLQRTSSEDLIDLMFEIALELRGRTTDATGRIEPAIEGLSFPDLADPEAIAFKRVPPREGEIGEANGNPWRIILISSNRKHELLGLEIHDDIVLGRASDEVTPDVDLTKYGAEKLNISRQHALIRPSAEGLLLMDLGSTNGTYCNGVRVRLGSPEKLSDLDTITLAGLHFKLQIARRPGEKAT